ncbi:MAG: hypothetical protein ABEI77_00490 [Halorientalis sp.]
MTDSDDPIRAFISEAKTIYGEYDEGYMDADAALRRLRTEIDDLDAATE